MFLKLIYVEIMEFNGERKKFLKTVDLLLLQ